MAKSGQITVSKGATSTVGTTIAPPSPTISPLGSVVANALAGADDPKTIVVNLQSKKVYVGDDAGVDGLVETNPDGSAVLVLTKDQTDVKSSPWSKVGSLSPTGKFAAVNTAITAAVKPARTLAQVVSAVEDALAAMDPVPTDRGVLVISQENGKVVYLDDSTDVTSNNNGLTTIAEVVAEQTYITTGGGPAPQPFE